LTLFNNFAKASNVYFRTKTVKGTPLVQLVESYRNLQSQPRQRVIASLGDASLPEEEKRAIAKAVESALKGQGDWLELEALSPDASSWVAKIVQLARRSKGGNATIEATTADGVLLDDIQIQEVVQLGPQLVAMKAWEALALNAVLEELGMNASAIATAQLLVFNRLIEPLSEWALIEWSQRTALPQLLGLSLTKTAKDRLYRTGDQLLQGRIKIETQLRDRQPELFDLERSVVLYDVTNTHFEGVCAKNPKARHGKNKQKRNDCPQVAIGMAFDEHGLPLAHEVFEGNTADTTTLVTILDRLEIKDGGLKPVVILDAGFASKSNLALLKELGYSYLINITRSSRAKYAQAFEAEGFEALPGRTEQSKVEVKKIEDPDDADSQLVLCRSAQRRLKEVAMLSNAEERFLKDLHALTERIAAGRLIDPEKIQRKIGTLQKKHPKVQRYYTIQFNGGALTSERKEAQIEQALDLCGDYVLKTDKSLDADQLWQLYMTLLKAERGFRILKGSLGLRPNYHQLEERVEAHIFISVLAYHLLSWIEHQLQIAGDTREWKTIRRILSTHCLASTILPLKDGTTLQVRKPSVPDPEQALLFQHLGIDWKQMCPAQKTMMK
jgi:transposase